MDRVVFKELLYKKRAIVALKNSLYPFSKKYES